MSSFSLPRDRRPIPAAARSRTRGMSLGTPTSFTLPPSPRRTFSSFSSPSTPSRASIRATTTASRYTASGPTADPTSCRPPSSRLGTSHRRSATANSMTTTTTADLHPDFPGDWIVAVLQGRGVSQEVGLVAIERELGQVQLTQFPDTPTFVKTLHWITARWPSLILVPFSALNNKSVGLVGGFDNNIHPLTNPIAAAAGHGGGDVDGGLFVGDGSPSMGASIRGRSEPTMLVRSLQEAWPDVQIVGLKRRVWNEQAGYEYLSQLIIDDDERSATILAVKPKYYTLSAAGALFEYLETGQSVHFSPRSLRVRYSAPEGTVFIDTESVANLELIKNLLSKTSRQSLLGLLNQCYTPMATRLLRTNIFCPLADTTAIDGRLDAVEELVNTEERFLAVRKALGPLRNLDIDKLVGQIASSRPRPINSTTDPSKESEAKITQVLLLRTILKAFAGLRTALLKVESSLLRTICRILMDDRVEGVLEKIADTLNEEATAALQKGPLAIRNTRIYAVKAERRMLLHVAREMHKENMNDCFELCEAMNEKYSLELSLAYSAQIGFSFTCLKSDLEDQTLPRIFTNITTKGKKLEFTSMEMKKKNARMKESLQEIFIMTDDVLDELFSDIRSGIACLYRSAEAIAMLDMLTSFADVASRYNYVRPEWTDTLAVKDGRHPLQERFRCADGSFMPNDTYATDAATFQIVTGSNMSGKSTLLRQIALMYVMAQIGSFVPASYASFRVVNAILTRLSNDDSIESSLSTFSKEMSVMAMIMSTLQTCKNCLIIVDELGRGTSPEEGIGIAHALSEVIIEAKAICFFATHFRELCTTLARFPNVVTLHLEAEIDRHQPDYSLTFHHRVRDGTTPLTHYGLELAKIAKLPSDVLEQGTKISAELERRIELDKGQSKSANIIARRSQLLALRSTLTEITRSRALNGKALTQLLREIQEETVRNLAATMEEADLKVNEEDTPRLQEVPNASSPFSVQSQADHLQDSRGGGSEGRDSEP